MQRPLDFIDTLTDPEKIAEVYEAIVPADATLGRFDAARAMTQAFDQATQRLSAHHRVHGVALTAELEELAGSWTTLRDLVPRVERAVEENLATPCVRNQRTLLVCAAATAVLGDTAESARLEAKAEALAMEGYERIFSPPRLRLALIRDDRDALGRIAEQIEQWLPPNAHGYWFEVAAHVTLIDALVVLGDRARVEAKAEPLLELKQTFIEPFALRALGRVRGDHSLIEQALARFEQMRLEWHAEQTRDLLTA